MEIGSSKDFVVHDAFFKNNSGIRCKLFQPEEITSCICMAICRDSTKHHSCDHVDDYLMQP